MNARARTAAVAATTMVAALLPVLAATTPAVAAQPVPNHTRLVPQVPRTDMPKISNGEIWDMAAIGNSVYIVGSFTSVTKGNTTTAVPGLTGWDINTGNLLPSFKPTIAGGVLETVEATPDGTKLIIGGTFKTVGGKTLSKLAVISPTTGAPLSTFTFAGNTNNPVTAAAATNTTIYVGGRFSVLNGTSHSGLAAVNATTGAVDPNFNLNLSGGIGVNGELTVQALKLTHDETKLVVIHTGRQINGQDRLGVAEIDTASKTLLPWRTRLWDDNLARLGGVTRIFAGDVSPDDSYMVVSEGSGGDAPPISDTAIRFPIAGADDVQPDWVSRHFDSVYSVAITEDAVYLGGHFQFEPSPTAPSPWPGLTNVGYGTGQGLSGYGLGDDVVRRDHLSAVDPATGHALEWDPGSNSFQGNKAMLATPRGLFAGGDAGIQGGKSVGRVAFFDFNNDPNAPTATDTTITLPIEGRVEVAGTPFTITGTATSPSGVKKVQVEIQNRSTKQWLAADGVTWQSKETNALATLTTPGATSTTYSLTRMLPATAPYLGDFVYAKTFGNTGSDASKAVKKIEVLDLSDQTPATNITGPSSSIISTLTFTMTGTATDDHGINRLSYWFRDENNDYLQNDGTVGPVFNTFNGTPDVIGAPNATWSYTVTLPHEGTWRGSATAVDTAGQADLRSGVRDWLVSTTAVAPTVTISTPVQMTPPFTVPAVVVSPGGQLTFSGTAADDAALQDVTITLRNTTTRENLGADGTWGTNVSAGSYRVSPLNINAPTYNWTYTTPFNLTPGTYSFSVTAYDQLGLPSSRGSLTINAQVPGDLFPTSTLNFVGTDSTLQVLHLDLGGTATDDHGVASERFTIFNNDTGQYLQPGGTLSSTYATVNAVLASPGATSTTFALSVDLPAQGSYSVTAWAWDSSGQQQTSTTGSSARYNIYPGDLPPTFDPVLGAPITGASFNQGVIVVSGRATDDQQIARVEVGIIDSLGRYMSSTGTFTSTTPSYRTAFLNSPGSLGSNFAYTSPVIPAGVYSVATRATDQHGFVSVPQIVTNITVTQPANNPPVAGATVSCVQNVCTFDGRSSTDEDTSTLSYSWSFGQGTGSTSPVPIKTYTAPGTFTPTLTVKDYWGLTNTFTMAPITIVMPPGNTAPVPTFITSCVALACGTSSSGTVDPNLGDTIAYSWNFGDGTALSTSTSPSHTYALQGTYTITLTTTDGWGNAASTSKVVNLTMPAGNVAPVPTFTVQCTALACLTNSFGTADPDGDVIRYSWNFGDGTAASTAASPAHTYAVAGTYTLTLTVTDGWNNTASTTRTVTVP
jgi:large repetitive protein